MAPQKKTDQTTPDGVVEHHPSCGTRCVAGCEASPKWPAASYSAQGGERREHRIRRIPGGAERAAPPLWEHIADWEAVDYARTVGTEIVTPDGTRTLLGLPLPQPQAYTAFERASERYSLDRWTAAGGVKDQELDAVHRAMADERKGRVREQRDVREVADLVRAAFGGVVAEQATHRPAVRKRPATARQLALLALVTGEAPETRPDPAAAVHAPMHEACEHIRHVFRAHAWALALILFGRERDPISDVAFGRLFPGEPIRDTRAPFSGVAHVLAAASSPLTGLGGGSCAWPAEDPRMRLRTWAKGDEMAVKATPHGSDHVRGEKAVHRILDARAAVSRAALTEHEMAAVDALTDRSATRDDKARRLREIEAWRRGLPADQWASREATADVSDADLLRSAKAALRRVEQATERQTREADRLTPVREQRPPRARGRHVAEAGYAHA